jgi:hypothetical protein
LNISTGNYDPIAIQRWRFMSVEAVFEMNHNIESELNDELTTEVLLILQTAFRLSRDHHGFPFSENKKLFLDINNEART